MKPFDDPVEDRAVRNGRPRRIPEVWPVVIGACSLSSSMTISPLVVCSLTHGFSSPGPWMPTPPRVSARSSRTPQASASNSPGPLSPWCCKPPLLVALPSWKNFRLRREASPTQCRPAPATAYGSGTGSAVPDKNAKSLQGARSTASAPHFAGATYASWGRKARAGRAQSGLGQRANGNRDASDAQPARPRRPLPGFPPASCLKPDARNKKKPGSDFRALASGPAHGYCLMRFSHNFISFIFLRRSRCNSLHTRGMFLG